MTKNWIIVRNRLTAVHSNFFSSVSQLGLAVHGGGGGGRGLERQGWFDASHSLKHAAEVKCYILTYVVPYACIFFF